MSKEEEEKEQPYKIKQPTEASFKFGFINEQPVHNVNGLVEKPITFVMDNTNMIFGDKNPNYVDGGSGEDIPRYINERDVHLDFNLTYKYDYRLDLFDLDEMRSKIANGADKHDVLNNMKNFIMENKDTNPMGVQLAISKLMGCVEKHYDNCVQNKGFNMLAQAEGYHREHLGNSSEEIMNKLLGLKEGEELHGLVCSTIHELGMRVLQECGIEATMIAGGTKSSNHTTLLWKRSDGKYVQTNYEKSYALDATNMKAAANEIYKDNLGLKNNGYIWFIDEHGSYQQYALKDEAVWGNELDKINYNNASMHNRTMPRKTAITGKANMSMQGSVDAEISGTIVYDNGTTEKATSISLGYKKSGVTSVADSSTSIGLKVEHSSQTQKDNGYSYHDSKYIVDYTQLHTNDHTYMQNIVHPVESKTFKDEEQVANLKRELKLEYLQMHPIALPKEDREELKQIWIEQNYKDSMFTIGLGNDKQLHFDSYNELANYENGAYLKHFTSAFDKFDELYPEEGLTKATPEEIEAWKQGLNEYIQEQMNWMLSEDGKNTNVVSPTNGHDTSHITAFVRQAWGRVKTLLQDDNITLSNGYEISGLLGLNYVTSSSFTFGGDARVVFQDGLKLDIAGKKSLFSTNVCGGITGDLSLKDGTLTPTISPGLKLNGGMSYQTKPTDNISFGASVSGYSEITKPSIDYGASAQLNAYYKLKNGTTIFGGTNIGMEKQYLNIGTFHEQTENNTTFGLLFGLLFKNNNQFEIQYNGNFDKLNSTKNRSIISVGANIKI